MLHVVQLEYEPDEISIYLVDGNVPAADAIKRASEAHYANYDAQIQRITCTHTVLTNGVPTLIY